MEEVSYPFFVYGTLRALPLLAHALTGDSKNTLTVTANMVVSRVHHYSRWGIENHDFAGAIEDPYGSMDGLLLYLSQAHRYRLESLRGPLFATKHVTVTLQSDMNVGADMWVFRGPSELLSNKPWSFDNFFHNVLSTWNLDGPEEPSRRRAWKPCVSIWFLPWGVCLFVCFLRMGYLHLTIPKSSGSAVS